KSEKATKNNQLLKWKISTGNTKLKEHERLVDVCSDQVDNPAIEVKDSDDCQIVYTSGTTGNPKGALFDHHRILHVGITISITMHLNPDYRLLHVAPLFHSAQLNLFLISGIYLGCTQIIHAQFDPTKVLGSILNVVVLLITMQC